MILQQQFNKSQFVLTNNDKAQHLRLMIINMKVSDYQHESHVHHAR